jgi:hypothetical protein
VTLYCKPVVLGLNPAICPAHCGLPSLDGLPSGMVFHCRLSFEGRQGRITTKKRFWATKNNSGKKLSCINKFPSLPCLSNVSEYLIIGRQRKSSYVKVSPQCVHCRWTLLSPISWLLDSPMYYPHGLLLGGQTLTSDPPPHSFTSTYPGRWSCLCPNHELIFFPSFSFKHYLVYKCVF